MDAELNVIKLMNANQNSTNLKWADEWMLSI